MLFVFVGPEMSQEERAEEGEQALEFERLREQGVSLREIGVSRAKGLDLDSGKRADSSAEKPSVELKEEA